jgi:protease PrsW
MATIQETAPRNAWWRLLLTGFGLYVIGILLLVFTGNPNLFPTVGMIGSFIVPAAFVSFLYQRRHLSKLSMPSTGMTFIYGGLLGVFAAATLEPLLVRSLDAPNAFLVGLIEESAKILGVLVIARRLRHDSEIDGVILGAAAGMGFAAFESMGYAFTAFLVSGGSLSSTVVVTLLRGLLSPVGHGTWTAILAGVLFRESGPRRFHVNLKVLIAYLTVVVLHGSWDSLPLTIGAVVSSGIDVFLANLLVGTLGLFLLWRRWREAGRLQDARIASVPDEGQKE